MSWKVHETDEVFAELRGLCSNSYRMYDPSEYRYYYDHECDAYECAVEDAAEEYERLLKHCTNQREQLAKLNGSQTIDILMELLNEYQESECAIAEDRVTYYADRLDGRTEDERVEERTKTEQNGVGSSKVRVGSSITDELRECITTAVWQYENGVKTAYIPKDKLAYIADLIDKRHSVKVERLEKYRAAVDAMLKEYIKLPVDADGVPIHVGDVMEGEKIGGGFGEPFEVVGYIMSNGELEPMDEHNCPRKHVYLRHHHAPTVEDVLREFAQAMNENMGMYTGEAIDADEWRDADRQTIAEYAAKLRLAGEAQ